MRLNIKQLVALSALIATTSDSVFADDNEVRQQAQQDTGLEPQISAPAAVILITEPAGTQRQLPGAKPFIKQTATENRLEMILGHLAEQKAQNPQVQQFAQEIVKAHQQANQQLQQVAQQKGVNLNVQQFQQMIRASGPQFDQAYVRYMTEQGREDLQHIEQVANNHPDQHIRQFARELVNDMRPQLQEAQRLQTQIQAGRQIQEPAGTQTPQQGLQQQVQQLEQQVQQLQQQVQQIQRTQQQGQQFGGQQNDQAAWTQDEMPNARQFVKMAETYGNFCVALSQVAMEKAQDQQVKQLAQQQQQINQKASQRLQQLGQQHGIEVSMQPVQKIIQARGKEFDQAYIRFITEHHRRAVQDLEQIANQHEDQAIKQFARAQLNDMRQHLQQAERMQTQLQAAGDIQEPAGAQQEQQGLNQDQQNRDQ